MKEYIKVFSSVSEYNTFKASASYHTPNISYISGTDVVLYNPTIEYPQVPLLANVKNFLSFVAQASGTFLFSNTVDYSIDNGITWSTLASNTASPTVAAGSKIMWKATLTPTSSGIGTFSSTANFIVQGNVMSLLYGDNFSGLLDLTGKDYVFKDLFAGCIGITNAYKLSLPATTLSEGCYKNMFKNCTGVVLAPILLAVTLEDSCYSNMFYGCTSLVETPELSATTLTNNCYEYMFYGCSSLTDIKCLATDITATDCTTNWVNGVASNGTFVKDSSMSSWTIGDSGIPTNWTESDYLDDYSQDYLTFEVLEPGAFHFNNKTSTDIIQYSTDNGSTWNSLTSSDYTETLPIGTKVLWKGTLMPNASAKGIGRFVSSGNFNISGNILSIIYGENYSSYTTIPSNTPNATTSSSLFLELFKDCKIIRSNKLSLPSNTLYRCYDSMFYGCNRLITTPKLPATTMSTDCYANMFRDCTSLVIPPELNATLLAAYCYRGMFYGCTSLLHAQSILPAMTLYEGCYETMFRGCTSLISGPELPANNVPTRAYNLMFRSCTSLEIAPDLPATTVYGLGSATESTAYWNIFTDCSSLIYVKCMARLENGIVFYTYLSGVARNGTFVKPIGLQYYNGIPSSWTVLEV